MLLYISGPMTGKRLKNFPAFERAAQKLRSYGYTVLSPHELDGSVPRSTWEECLRRDIRYEMTCDGVAVLPGWRKSRGARLETYIARKLKWPVRTVDAWMARCRL